jgi:hypothetical protein
MHLKDGFDYNDRSANRVKLTGAGIPTWSIAE